MTKRYVVYVDRNGTMYLSVPFFGDMDELRKAGGTESCAYTWKRIKTTLEFASSPIEFFMEYQNVVSAYHLETKMEARLRKIRYEEDIPPCDEVLFVHEVKEPEYLAFRVETPIGTLKATPTARESDYPGIRVSLERPGTLEKMLAVTEYERTKKAFQTVVYSPGEDEPIAIHPYDPDDVLWLAMDKNMRLALEKMMSMTGDELQELYGPEYTRMSYRTEMCSNGKRVIVKGHPGKGEEKGYVDIKVDGKTYRQYVDLESPMNPMASDGRSILVAILDI